MNCVRLLSQGARNMGAFLSLAFTVMLASASVVAAQAGSPQLFTTDGDYIGNVNANQFDPNSIANPYGRYGSPFSPDSVNNPYGRYGSQFSPGGAANPYATTGTPRIFSPDGTYLGRYSANEFYSDSTGNQFGQYGSQFSPTSINNQFGNYGSRFSPNGAMNPFGYAQPPSPMTVPMGVRGFVSF
jgi:hypothetical protein